MKCNLYTGTGLESAERLMSLDLEVVPMVGDELCLPGDDFGPVVRVVGRAFTYKNPTNHSHRAFAECELTVISAL